MHIAARMRALAIAMAAAGSMALGGAGWTDAHATGPRALPAAAPAALPQAAPAGSPAGTRAVSPAILPQADTFELARRYAPGSGALRLEISKSARELYVYIDDERVRTLDVAIGQPDHPTPTGEFGIHQVDWNPDWTPPDSEWAEGEEYRAPGEEGNPMGRARLIYRAPYSLHGTDVLESLGEARSHGSVRVANAEILDLARLVQEHGGAGRSEEWYRNAVATPTEMFEVHLEDPVTLVIRD